MRLPPTLFLSALLLCLISAQAQADKREDIPGYAVGHLTDDTNWDTLARVSPNGLVVWSGRGGLPGATSGGSDDEIFGWDGGVVTQLTDNDIFDVRPVVNNLGDVAWQLGGNSITVNTEILLRLDGVVTQLTTDSVVVVDRYPDINDRGVVAWGRRNAAEDGWELAVYDPLKGLPYTVSFGVYSYRPHVNNLDHLQVQQSDNDTNIYDLDRNIVVDVPPPPTIGYADYDRQGLNDQDELVITARRPGEPWQNFQGRRDILFWDGFGFEVIWQSPGPWYGRPELNNNGVIVFEGFGGLVGSTSGGSDSEIFVYDPAVGTVVQLTDDNDLDFWSQITDDGTIYWTGHGRYPSALATGSDREIFRALPNGDSDADSVANPVDNCPLEPNPDQRDTGGLGGPSADGTGDACQCGDVDDDGQVLPGDLAELRAWLSGAIPELSAPRKCGTDLHEGSCNLLEAVRLSRALEGLRVIEKGCPAYRPFDVSAAHPAFATQRELLYPS